MLDLYRMSATPNPKTILRKDEVLRRSALKTTRLYELIKQGEFPAQVSIGARAVGWYEDEVQAWIDMRPATNARKGRRDDGTQAAPPDKRGENQPHNPADKEHVAAVEATLDDPCDRTPKTKPERRAISNAATGGQNATPVAHDARESEGLTRMRIENSQLKLLLANLMLENDALRTAIHGGKSAA